MTGLSFRARVRNHGGNTWYYVEAPRSQTDRLGTRARVPVRGRANGVPIRTTLLPDGDGGFILVLDKRVRGATGLGRDDIARLELSVDRAPRVVRVPRDLAAALSRAPRARRFFEGLALSHRRRFVDWLNESKRAETRARRIVQTLALLDQKRTRDR